MGTNASYGGSSSKDWKTVRELWGGLGPSDLPSSSGGSDDGASPGDVPLPQDYQASPSLDALGKALADALGKGLQGASKGNVPLVSLLPRRTSRGSGGGGAGGASGGGSTGTSGNSGRTGTGSRQVQRQAARGGAAIGAAVAYRDRDGAALAEYGTTLEALDAMTPRQRNIAILDLVLGDAGHPDEAAVRAAALEQVKALGTEAGKARDAAEAVRSFVGQLVVQIGLVELRDQYAAGAATRQEIKRRETSLRQWVASKVHHLDLAKYGRVTSRDCHKTAFRMAADALRLMRKK